MNLGRGLPAAFFLAFLIVAASGWTALAQCPDTVEEDSQKGCPDPFNAEISKPRISRDFIEFNISVRNRKIVFPPDCNPGELFCYENLNYQGLPLCTGNWSGLFQDVKVEMVSCYPSCDFVGCPDCDFNVTITPSKGQKIENEKSQSYTVKIKVYNGIGDYDFTFGAFLSAAKKRVFSLRLSISDQPLGTGGDNDACPACISEKCDLQKSTCESKCADASYCASPECLFDTPYSGASESCCGDDSGERYKECIKESGISWSCPFQSACCEFPSSCVHSGKCYAEGKTYALGMGEDKYAYCSSGTWHDCDGSQETCSGCGFSWNNSACCGDDQNEYYKSRICFFGCESDMADRSCCTIATACVYKGKCYLTGDLIVLGGKNVTCEGGVWSEKLANQSVCYKGECNNKDKCEGACPQCIFKDFSCYGTICDADYWDPDAHWTYCSACSLNWSFEEKKCCGDDEKEYWSSPCPNTTASWKCCSNPGGRVNKNGECVIFCGTSIAASAAELQENMTPLSVSLLPEIIDVQIGKTSEFKVLIRTEGGKALHNLMLGFCGPFSLNVSPLVIDELAPNENKSFTVRLAASPDLLPGSYIFSVYVSSNEMTGKNYRQAVANILLPPEQQPSYEIYLAIASVMAAIYIAKKLRSRRTLDRRTDSTYTSRQSRREAAKVFGKGKPKGDKKSSEERKRSARSELAELVREELEKGTPEKELRQALASEGLKKEDVEAAFREAKKKS